MPRGHVASYGFSPSSGYRRWRLSANSKYSPPNVRVSSPARPRTAREDQRDRSEHLPALSQFTLDDPHVLGRGADRAAPQGVTEGIEEDLAGGAEIAAED